MPLKKYRKCFGCRFYGADDIVATAEHGCGALKPKCFHHSWNHDPPHFKDFEPLTDKELMADRAILRLKGEIELVD